MWIIEVGQAWRNERAGVKNGDLLEGVAPAATWRWSKAEVKPSSPICAKVNLDYQTLALPCPEEHASDEKHSDQ